MMRNQNSLITKIFQGLILAILIGMVLGKSVHAQNIQVKATTTSIGSPSFGFVITPTELGRVMQADTAPTCVTVGVNARECTSLGLDGLPGTRDDYFKSGQIPGPVGSFTHNPFKRVDSTPEDGFSPLSASLQTAPVGDNGFSSFFPIIEGVTNIDLGIEPVSGTPLPSAGHIRFILPTFQNGLHTTIDQLIEQQVDGAGGMVIQTLITQ